LRLRQAQKKSRAKTAKAKNVQPTEELRKYEASVVSGVGQSWSDAFNLQSLQEQLTPKPSLLLLSNAVQSCQVHLVILLASQADPLEPGADGRTALQHAVLHNSPPLVKALNINYNHYFSQPNGSELSAFQEALALGHVELVEWMLLESGVNLELHPQSNIDDRDVAVATAAYLAEGCFTTTGLRDAPEHTYTAALALSIVCLQPHLAVAYLTSQLIAWVHKAPWPMEVHMARFQLAFDSSNGRFINAWRGLCCTTLREIRLLELLGKTSLAVGV
jgi:hypothetical protein